MKKLSLINRFKSVRKQLKGMRLTVVLAIVVVLLVGATSVAAYTTNLQNKKIQLTEKIQKKPAKPAPKQEKKNPVTADDNTSANNQSNNHQDTKQQSKIAQTSPAPSPSKGIANPTPINKTFTITSVSITNSSYYCGSGTVILSIGDR